ncbi:MAG: hypothetical protein JWN41_1561, partial [Thermoleophilia bacterium]|nr:hypothetical protein [Thermoleophilia bacterium]
PQASEGGAWFGVDDLVEFRVTPNTDAAGSARLRQLAAVDGIPVRTVDAS